MGLSLPFGDEYTPPFLIPGFGQAIPIPQRSDLPNLLFYLCHQFLRCAVVEKHQVCRRRPFIPRSLTGQALVCLLSRKSVSGHEPLPGQVLVAEVACQRQGLAGRLRSLIELTAGGIGGCQRVEDGGVAMARQLRGRLL